MVGGRISGPSTSMGLDSDKGVCDGDDNGGAVGFR